MPPEFRSGELPEPDAETRKRLRRVVIEERQQKVIDHARASRGYADDVGLHAHDRATFKLINQRKDLDELPGSDFVVPALDDWKHWTRMNDWDSRNRVLELLTAKMRRREASGAEVEFLIVVCRPTWMKVVRQLRRYGGVDLDPGAEGRHRREEAARVNELDREEVDSVVQEALADALISCPNPFPRFFFKWLQVTLTHRALDHVRRELGERPAALPHDVQIKNVIDSVLSDRSNREAAIFAAPASPKHAEWLRTLDLDALFELSYEYATYARVGTACERAVGRLPRRQRQVIQGHYFEAMTQADVAAAHHISASTVRTNHASALRNLYRDDDLFEVLEAVGKVRDRDRRLQLEATRLSAAA